LSIANVCNQPFFERALLLVAAALACCCVALGLNRFTLFKVSPTWPAIRCAN
jgi:hypothetical protein